jgi:hypothetical protein
MSLVGWSRKYEQYRPVTDVPERVRKTEVWYWCSMAGAVAFLVAGLVLLAQGRMAMLGLFLAVSGVVDIALIKIWAHIRLATYQIILELQARDRT